MRIYYTCLATQTDEADNHLLALAVAGDAHYVLTRNLKDVARMELRFDNEAGKGNHYHHHGQQFEYAFISTDQLIDDFFAMLNETESSR